MPVKKKKSGSAARYGARYGKKVRVKVVKVERKQRKKQTCPFCNKDKVKRVSNGIWECSRCKKKFASNTYYLK